MKLNYRINQLQLRIWISLYFTLMVSMVTNLAASNLSVSDSTAPEKKWYELIHLRSYSQLRYNRLLETNPKLKCEQCDKSWGENGSFFFRRIRMIFSGQISQRLSFYLQYDFASSPSSTVWHYGQLRDAYFDIGLDSKNEFRIRAGQSKVPFGFENLQSSQNRLPLDRADALNSAMPNERDLGLFFMWAPSKVRKLYSELIKKGLKGSGDYGAFSIGLFNGQTTNKPDLNNNLYSFVRMTYPFFLGDQIIEPGVQFYTGKYTLAADQLSIGVKVKSDKTYKDQRTAGTIVVYPKPLGIMAEYNVGTGPQFNPGQDSILQNKLKGGYAQLSYMIHLKKMNLIPFVRYQVYQGGKKQELDARSYDIKELELGFEWQLNKNIELVSQYTISNRRFEDYKLQDNLQKGNLVRLQLQVSF